MQSVKSVYPRSCEVPCRFWHTVALRGGFNTALAGEYPNAVVTSTIIRAPVWNSNLVLLLSCRPRA